MFIQMYSRCFNLSYVKYVYIDLEENQINIVLDDNTKYPSIKFITLKDAYSEYERFLSWINGSVDGNVFEFSYKKKISI